MNELSLFTGGGGGIWGSKLLGWRTVGYVEQDEYCQRVIRQRIKDGIFDDAPIFSDVRTFDGRPYRGKVDIITAGFPCQPFSVAGRRRGEQDERNMWPDTIRIIGEVRPRFCLLENVPGLVTSGYFPTILKDIAEAGYNAKWDIISAAEVGAPHWRKRLWIFCHTEHAGLDAAEIAGSTGTSICNSEKGQDKSGESEGAGYLSDTDEHGRKLQPGGGQRTDRQEAIYVRSYGEKESLADGHSKGLERQRAVSITSEQEHPNTSDGGWWATEPAVGRVAHGMADRKHRLKALGNGQVPRVVVEAWNRLTGGAG